MLSLETTVSAWKNKKVLSSRLCYTVGDELFGDSYNYEEVNNGFFYEAEGNVSTPFLCSYIIHYANLGLLGD